MASGYDNPSHSIAARPWHVDDNPLSLLPLQEARAVAAGVGVRALAMGSSGARGGLAAEVAEAQQEEEAARTVALRTMGSPLPTQARSVGGSGGAPHCSTAAAGAA